MRELRLRRGKRKAAIPEHSWDLNQVPVSNVHALTHHAPKPCIDLTSPHGQWHSGEQRAAPSTQVALSSVAWTFHRDREGSKRPVGSKCLPRVQGLTSPISPTPTPSTKASRCSWNR